MKKKRLKSTKVKPKENLNIFSKLESIIFNFNKTQWFIIITAFIVGTLIRLRTLFTSGFKFDTVDTQYKWGEALLTYGFGSFWDKYFIDYTPGGVMLDAFLVLVSRPFDPVIPGDSGQAFVTTAKVFYWIFEIILAMFLFKVVYNSNKKNKTKAVLFASYLYITPILWVISTFWGQMDTFILFWGIILMFLFASLQKYNADVRWYKNRFFWTGIILGVLFTVKMHIFIFLPAFILLLYFDKPIKESLKFALNLVLYLALVALMAAVLALVYFYLQNVHLTMVFIYLLVTAFIGYLLDCGYKRTGDKKFLISIGFLVAFTLINLAPVLGYPSKSLVTYAGLFTRGNQISNGATVFWSVLPLNTNDSTQAILPGILNLSISQAGMIITLAILAILLLSQNKKFINSLLPLNGFYDFIHKFIPKKFDISDAFMFSSIFMTSYFLFMTGMHSRYLIFGAAAYVFAYAFIYKSKYSLVYLLGGLLVHMGFFFNQLGVFTAWYGSDDLDRVVKYLPIDYAAYFSVLGFAVAFGYYLYFYFRLRDSNNSGS